MTHDIHYHVTHFSGCSSLTDRFTESARRSELLPLHLLPPATLTTSCVESGTSLSHVSLRETIMTPFTCTSEIDITPWVKGCERRSLPLQGEVCLLSSLHRADTIVQVDNFCKMTCLKVSHRLIHFSIFALLSSYIIISLSLSLPLILLSLSGLLHNVQLYLLQLRILIFPTRQSARANQERRGKERTRPFYPACVPCLVNSITPAD